MSNPFARLLSRLSVGRKLMLIYLLDLTAVIFVSSILINEKFIAIDFARKEIAGNAYIDKIRPGFVAALRSAGGAAPSGDHADALASAERLHGQGMQTAELNVRLRLAHALLLATPPEQHDGAIAEATASGRMLITRVGNQSNLILDPDLDSYYTMSLILLRYPELLEIVDGIRVQQATLGHTGISGNEARTRYLILEGKLDATVQGILSDHAEARAAGDAELAGQLEPSNRALQAALDAYRRSARALVEGNDFSGALQAAEADQQALVTTIDQAWATAGSALERLLEKRVQNLYQRMWVHLGTALALLFAILAIVYFVARQIASPLRHLAEVTDTVSRTGDYSRRAQWSSTDEIGRLVGGFNAMLAQLDRERESQKELAASARAADAQRELVEATPIALMVTAIPGHEVLHANPPAGAWLNGRREDPWRHGLETSVRGRFFQQLADRGRVDEFEVRWNGGAEPSWAVLSARRVRFQGQDAVLTAFAPINHLKLMERRLQLWAKVFETSSEGILIVDAERRILTVNKALSRLTGYDPQEMEGQAPALVLTGCDTAHATAGHPETLWQAVAARGTWQGEISMSRRNGSRYPAWTIVNVVRQAAGAGLALGEISHYIFTSIDISDRKKSEQRIRFLAEHDVLTELPNRSLCTERLRAAVQQAARSGARVGVVFVDLDRFKDINDSLGHHIGDGLLRSVAQRLLEAVRPGDTVSRLGGDEFVIVLNGLQDVHEAGRIVEERLLPLIRRSHSVEGAELHVSCSAGIAIFPDDAEDIDTLMRHADTAMYQAKGSGKDTAQFFTSEMNSRAQARRRLDADLRLALEQRQFSLHWQPRIDAASNTVLGAEGLLRWHHPERGLVAPAAFIPLVEENGQIVPIGAWVIDEACRQMAAWRRQGLPQIAVSINLSVRQLRDQALSSHVSQSMARHGIGPGQLELELTESILMDDAEANLRQMHALRALGVGLSIDDFGTGYSSLAYLNRFPIDKLKIDRSFVHDMLTDHTDRAITMAIISLGHALGLKVVAEGVERLGEVELLREAGCDELQGYFYARPMPAEALAGWLARRDLRAGEPSIEAMS